MTLKIDNIYDLLEYAKEHPNYQYTCYDGEWLIYPDDSYSYLKDINAPVNSKTYMSMVRKLILKR